MICQEECQIKSQNICQIECQVKRQKERHVKCQVECQIKFVIKTLEYMPQILPRWRSLEENCVLVVNSPGELQKNGKWERGSKRLEIKMKSSLLHSRVIDMLMCQATLRTWLIYLGISRTLACPPSQTRLCLREIYLH